jgi:uncharacterized protein (TIGR02266 family)
LTAQLEVHVFPGRRKTAMTEGDVITLASLGGVVCLLTLVLIMLIVSYYRKRSSSYRGKHVPIRAPSTLGKERREHPRAKTTWPVEMETSQGTITAETKDISIGGAFITCPKPLPIKEVFRLTMNVPDGEPISAVAEVVWSNSNVPDDKVIHRGMGIRFIQISDEHIQFIKQIFE